jgi:hypothetical protein
MRAQHCPEREDNDAHLGDVIPFRAARVVHRQPPPRDDHHWAKRAAFVIGGVLVVWWGLILWVALP